MIPLPLVPAWLAAGSFPMVAAVEIHDRVGDWTLVAGGLVSLAALASAFYGIKWKAAAGGEQAARIAAQELAKTMEASRDEYKAERDSARVSLGAKLDEATALIREQADQIADLRARPSLEAVSERLTKHDDAARKRDEALIENVQRMVEAVERVAGHCPLIVAASAKEKP